MNHCLDSLLTGSRDLKHTSKLIYDQLPSGIVWHASDLLDAEISSSTLYSRLITRLEHLQNLFLLERLLLKHGHSDAQELIDISREMLRLTSRVWKESDRLTGLHGDFEWLVSLSQVFSLFLTNCYR